ncbi:MAG: signal recognition particle-docking protein FtsY [Mycoplasma sp.]|nr:signal recognition particle-docking protein FtsY [Mycoplasma sp.]
MKFFKKLKTRLLTLDVDRTKIKKNTKGETTQVNLEDFDLEQKDFSSSFSGVNNASSFSLEDTVEFKSDAVIKKEKQIIKKEKQKKLKELKKAKKIDKYIAGLTKSSSSFTRRLKEIQSRHNNINESYFEDLEEILIMSDISMDLVTEIIDEVKKEVKIENIADIKLINEIIAEKIFIIYTNKSNVDTTLNIKEGRINVILMVGINGSGKTTSIAKLANKFKNEGKNVVLAAADTFRAGAVEQLGIWAERIGVDIIKPKKEGADPASVVYDAIEKSKSQKTDVLIIDTAGRMQNKINLMNELKKISKILKNSFPDAPHESLLVIDSTIGQNAISQAIEFKKTTPLTGIILTKMDGTSKGGIILSIKDKIALAVKFIGLGENLEDLQEFDLDIFIYAMMKDIIDD